MNPERRLSFKADNAGGFAEIVPEKMSEGFIERELSTGEYIVCGIEAESFEELVRCMAISKALKYKKHPV